MKRTETTWSCDICNKENVMIAGGFHTITGYSVPDGGAVGVFVSCSPMGSYRKDLCQECAENAIIKIGDRIAVDRRALAHKQENDAYQRAKTQAKP